MDVLSFTDPVEAQQESDLSDGLDDAERARLHRALDASDDDIANGRVRAAEDVLAELSQLYGP